MAKSPNLDLELLPDDISNYKLKDWALAMGGSSKDSNMMKLEEAYNNLNEKKTDINEVKTIVSDAINGLLTMEVGGNG